MTQEKACIEFKGFSGGYSGFRIEQKAVPKCNGIHTDFKGNIMNPSYPYSDYSKNMDCNWKVELSAGQRIEFTIQQFQLDPDYCKHTYVKFTRIRDHANNELRICGKRGRLRLTSVNEKAEVSFQSGFYWFRSDKGFWVKYRALGCKEDDIPTGGKRSLINKSAYYYFGYVARFKCQYGYEFPAGAVEAAVSCTENDSTGPFWKGNIPNCKEILCGDPGFPPGGGFSLTNGRRVGSEAKYKCKEGLLIGNEVRKCQISGEWTGTIPRCHIEPADQCDDPGEPNHGMKIGNDYSTGANVSFICDIGHDLEVRTCPPLTAPVNGAVNASGFQFGDDAVYACDTGFILTGSNLRSCSHFGNWTESDPICKEVECPPPVHYVHSDVAYNGVSVNSMATYSCDIGFEMEGLKDRICQIDGTWIGDPPICNAIRCGMPENITNGRIDIPDDLYMHNATYTCNAGFHILADGNPTSVIVTCLITGNWSQSNLDCVQITSSTTPIPTISLKTSANTFKTTENTKPNGETTKTISDGPTKHTAVMTSESSSTSAPSILPSTTSGYTDITTGKIRPSSAGSKKPTPVTGESSTCTSSSATRNVTSESTDHTSTSPINTSPTSTDVISTSTFRSITPNDTSVPPTDLQKNTQDETPGSGVIIGCVVAGLVLFILVTLMAYYVKNRRAAYTSETPANGFENPIYANPHESPIQINSDGDVEYKPSGRTTDIFLNRNDGAFVLENALYGETNVCIGTVHRVKTPTDYPKPYTRSMTGTTESDRANMIIRAKVAELDFNGRDYLQIADTVSSSCFITKESLIAEYDRDNRKYEKYVLFSQNPQICYNFQVRSRYPKNTKHTGFRIEMTEIPKCNGNFINYDEGDIVSPGYPKCKYKPGTHCKWNIFAEVGQRLEITFIEFELRLNNDKVMIDSGRHYEFTNRKGKKGKPFVTYSYNATVEFVTFGTWNSHKSYDGFRLSFSVVGCKDRYLPRGGHRKFEEFDRYYHDGFVMRYNCHTGFKLPNGEHRGMVECKRNGNEWAWKGRVIDCIGVTCSKPGKPTYGDVVYAATEYGSKATYSCSQGASLHGDNVRTCLGNGQWSGEIPTCTPVSTVAPICDDPGRPQDGKKLGDDYSLGSIVTFECDVGHNLIGEKQITCIKGKWNHPVPECRLVTCLPLSNPKNGVVVLDGLEYGDVAIYNCSKGYILNGTETRQCSEDGNWMNDPPICREVNCEAPRYNAHCTVEVSGQGLGEVATYSCDTGYRLLGLEQRFCEANEMWSGEAPSCETITCSSLIDPINGHVVTEDGIQFGDEAIYNCSVGFTLNGIASRTCTLNGTWSGEIPICTVDNIISVTTCMPLANPSNGNVNISNGLSYGSVATYSCSSCYKLTGKSTSRTCEVDGKWTSVEPVCQEVKCANPREIRNGKMSSTSTTCGSIVKYDCDEGFHFGSQITETSASISCQENGQWNAEVGDCTVNTCQSLVNPSHGKVALSDSLSYGSTATYSCSSCYKLTGKSSKRICRADGKWTGTETVCKEVECSNPLGIANGNMSFTSTTCGSIVKYDCDKGFHFGSQISETSASISCQENGQWNAEVGDCTINTCPSLARPSNGKVALSDSLSYGSIATYSCSSCYKLTGKSSKRICGADGKWTGTEPVCKEVECSNPFGIANGTMSFTSTTCGSIVKYDCDKGFHFGSQITETSASISCQENGQWNAEVGDCTGNTCQSLASPSNGNVALSDKLSYGSTATYSCSSCYKLTGKSTKRICKADGKWTGLEPVCEEVKCTNPLGIANGNMIFTSTTCGSIVKYDCDKGFHFGSQISETSAFISCQENGQWNSEVGDCTVNTCQSLASPSHGKVALSDSLSYGSTATYSCSSCYKLTGKSSKRICRADGKWTGTEPVCKEVECSNPLGIANGTMSFTSTTCGSIVKYDCDKGFHFGSQISERSALISCQENGQWNSEVGDCTVNTCQSLASPSNGKVALSDSLSYGSTATYSCSSCYKLTGKSTKRICKADGKWTGLEPVCEEVKCTNPLGIANGNMSFTSTTCGSIVKYDCDKGFHFGSQISETSAFISCQENRQWNSEVGDCTVNTCQSLASPSNGKVALSDSLSYGSTATYSCSSCYKLTGKSTMRICKADGKWTGLEPVCEEVKCTNPLGIANGNMRFTSKTCGSIVKYDCDKGFHFGSQISETSASISCQENGQWNAEVGDCTVNTCQSLASPSHGKVALSDSLSYGSTATYSCSSCYKLTGKSSKRICRADGKWTGVEPVCEEVRCSAPPAIENGRISFTSTTCGVALKYDCDEGFHFGSQISETSISITCQQNGEWSTEIGDCKLKEEQKIENTSLTPQIQKTTSAMKFSYGGHIEADSVSDTKSANILIIIGGIALAVILATVLFLLVRKALKRRNALPGQWHHLHDVDRRPSERNPPISINTDTCHVYYTAQCDDIDWRKNDLYHDIKDVETSQEFA
ncbi:sushi, von Willebrand factor type A, EGF and pentraxin domain-containing protein 1-like [Tubulanus polymorphus]|uniref:sushi, von Willebrand factor type A, EGF and pentraxin domain-containing protein 1-like n=1 Tax=Tubulanus polymorphus TaxID=672921 RepID=UPI003DA386FB